MGGDPSVPKRGGATFGVMSVAATASVWVALAALVFMLRRAFPRASFDGWEAGGGRALVGALGGAAIAGSQILLLRVWPAWRRFTREAVAHLRLSSWEVVAVALIVAFAEELFFRAALQPLVGLWLSSAVFALGHMRYDRSAWARENLRFGLTALAVVLLVSAALGTIFARAGLLAAMTAHFVYDVIVLTAYMRLRKAGGGDAA